MTLYQNTNIYDNNNGDDDSILVSKYENKTRSYVDLERKNHNDYMKFIQQKHRNEELNIKELKFYDQDLEFVQNCNNTNISIFCIFENKNATFVYQKPFVDPFGGPLRFKYNFLKKIHEKSVNHGFPIILYPQKEQDVNYIMITDMDGENLESIRGNLIENEYKFIIKDIIKIAVKGIQLIQTLHENGFLHCNITPESFYFDQNKQIIRLDNFCRVKTYQHNKDCKKFKPNTFPIKKKIYTSVSGENINETFCFSNQFTSTFNLRGEYFSRRDDLQSFGLILIYLFNGSLPWTYNSDIESVEIKTQIPEKDLFDKLCKKFPEEFKLYFEHVNSLEFEDQPNYQYLIDLFTKMKN
jgi:serine/threonine protein kinase